LVDKNNKVMEIARNKVTPL